MNNILVSIIVPVYKVPEQYLRQCIESCINQTMRGIEIILVDDGSPDDCGKICDEYAERDERMKVIHKENGGLAAARNTGQDAAIGETLMFLDGDDYLDLDCCELTYNRLIQYNVDVLLFAQTYEYGNSSKKVFRLGEDERLLSEEETKNLQARVLEFDGGVATAYMKLIKRSLLVENNIRHIDELKQGAEGYVFCIQLFRYCYRAYYLNKAFYHYIYNEQSICHVSTENNNYLILRCFDFILDYIKGQENEKTLVNKCLTRFLYIIVTVAISGYFNPANKLSYQKRVRGFKRFISEKLPNQALQNADRTELDRHRLVILKIIDLKLYPILYFIGLIRRKQLKNK